jgi:hypothetical protein
VLVHRYLSQLPGIYKPPDGFSSRKPNENLILSGHHIEVETNTPAESDTTDSYDKKSL